MTERKNASDFNRNFAKELLYQCLNDECIINRSK